MFDSVTESVLGLIRAVNLRPVVVGIDGQGGAGKSTFVAHLVDCLPASSLLVHGDDFYRDMPDSERLALDARRGADQYFDWQRLRSQVLNPIGRGEALLRYQCYDWNAGSMGQWVEVSMPDVIIIEGVYTLRPELRDALHVKVYVHADEVVRLRRQADRGENSSEWIRRWVAAENYYVKTFAPQAVADIVVQCP